MPPPQPSLPLCVTSIGPFLTHVLYETQEHCTKEQLNEHKSYDVLSWYEYVREQELHRAIWIHLKRSMSPDAQTTAEVKWGHTQWKRWRLPQDNDDKLQDGRQAEDDGGEKEEEPLKLPLSHCTNPGTALLHLFWLRESINIHIFKNEQNAVGIKCSHGEVIHRNKRRFSWNVWCWYRQYG